MSVSYKYYYYHTDYIFFYAVFSQETDRHGANYSQELAETELAENQLVAVQIGQIDGIQEKYFRHRILQQTIPEVFFYIRLKYLWDSQVCLGSAFQGKMQHC